MLLNIYIFLPPCESRKVFYELIFIIGYKPVRVVFFHSMKFFDYNRLTGWGGTFPSISNGRAVFDTGLQVRVLPRELVIVN